MTTTNTVTISEIPVSPTDTTKTAWGAKLADQYFFVIANGSGADETFDAADIGAATKTLMATYGRGITVSMGAGNDTVIGSDYGDTINGGDGTNYIDGGANLGAAPGGYKARDVLNVFAASQAAVDALGVTALSATATGADGDAYAAGYRIKVTNGTETDYLKNVEQVNVFVAAGAGYTYAKTVRLSVDVMEVDASQPVDANMHLAWAQGTAFGDTFNAQADVSAATRALMDQNGRGVWVDTGAGDDNVTGSAYGDDINAGSGTNYVDGGANAGSPPWGGKAMDVLHVTVASQAAADAVQVVALSASSTGLDLQAFNNGYTLKVTAAGETDYVKGIERVTVQVADGNGGASWARDIPLTVVAHEANLSDASANYYHLAWVQGTANADTIDASAGSDLLSAEVKAAMAARGRGVWIDGGAGNDTITGSAYADNFRNGAGNAKIDGGANAGPNGQAGMDVFEITVASSAEMSAVTVAASDDPNYQWMVTYGANSTQKDYLKNIEAIVVNVNGTATGKWIPLAVNVNEIAASGDLANSMHYAWAQGTAGDDNFDATTAVSAATRTLMDQHGRGVYVDLGAGNDTVKGSAYGDNISVGSGTNFVDGGDNADSPPWGGKAVDVLQVTVASQAAAGAVQVVQLSAASTGADGQAFAKGYTTKVVAGAETDYIKGIERVTVMVDGGNGNLQWARDIALTVVAHEANLADANSANYYHLAWVNGTDGADTIDASALLSDGIKAAMDASKRGVWIDGGTGGDTITGSAYADNIRNGAGNDKVDGGANAAPSGQQRGDVFEISVASSTEMAAIKVAPSDDANYQWMVTYGAGSTQKDYLKNIEAIVVNVNGTSTGKWIPLALQVSEAADATNSPVAWAFGTEMDDNFDPSASLSATALANLDKYQHGIYADLGAGNDTATGTAYGDEFNMGAGTNYVVGGANAGVAPWGGNATDVLYVNTAGKSAADAVQVTVLAAGMSGADADAFSKGYTHKVVAAGETDYLKGIERIVVMYPDGSNTMSREIPLAVIVHEANLADANLDSYYHLAWVNGTDGNDTIDASAGSPLLSDAVKGAMDSHKRGVWIDGGAGNDVITGSGYADNFRNGAGNAKIDGGANVGPNGQKAMDVFEISVASSAELSAVRVQQSDDPDYQWMVTYGAGSTQKDYLKNIEGVSINVAGTTTGKWIPLALSVGEADPHASGLEQYSQFAWAQGTALDETFNAATDVSAATRALMDQYGRGVQADMGAGNDTVTGSGYGDTVVLGSGTNYFDGGANAGTTPEGRSAVDTLEVYVASRAAADAVAVTELTASMSGADGEAYAAGYRFKLVNGSAETDYLKGVETVNIFTWNDSNGNGQRDYGANEVAFARTITLAVNSAPTFGGAPAGVAVSDAGYDYSGFAGTVLASGKLLAASLLADTSTSEYMMVLNRSNADGSVDTSFGNGSGRVIVPTSFNNFAAPVELPGGKLLVAVSTFGSNNAFKVMRLNADGSVDTSFGTNGATVVSVGTGNDLARTLAVDPNGKIVVAGSAGSASGTDMALVRLNADGSVDTGFNGSGKLTFAPGSTVNAATAISFTADGKIVVTGYATGTGGDQLALARVNVDGTLDGNFGSGGKLTLPVTAAASYGRAVQLLANGKMLVAGYGREATGGDTDPVLLRLNADGSADAAFGTNGMVKTHLSAQNDKLLAMQVQADGKIVTLTSTGADTSGLGAMVGVTRYNADGSLDTSFGTGGTTRVSVHGVGEQPASLALAGGKIVVFGASFNDVSHFTASNVIVRLNADGSPDAGFGVANPSSLGGSVRADGYHPIALDTNAAIYDAELAARGNYGGASLTLARHGGASADDLFAGVGEVSLAGGAIKVAGLVIGTATQSAGTLTITFNSAASQGMVNRALHGIGYANGSSTASGQVTIDWTFSDGNDGSQGFGLPKQASGSTTVQIGMLVDEIGRSLADASLTSTHDPLSSVSFIGRVQGTVAGDSFDSASGFSAAARGLMDEFKRGATFDMGPGDDAVSGTAYADYFVMGAGTNRVDGGGNGTPGRSDVLGVYASAADAGAVKITLLDASATGADKDAFAAGYTVKVAAGSETDYLKNVQQVDVWTWNDANGNHVRDSGETSFVRSTPLMLRVYEVPVSSTDPTTDTSGNKLSSLYYLASATGWSFGDSFNAATDVSAAAQARMATYQRGVYVDGGAGDDTIVGTSYGDSFVGGAGVNRIDGGANDGTDPSGYAARDYLAVYVNASTDVAAVTAIKLSADMTGADGDAFKAGYTWKLSAPGETDYLKNVEQADVFTWSDTNGNGQRDSNERTFAKTILLAPRISEIRVSGPDATKDANGNDLSTFMHFAWADGTSGDNVIDASTLSATTQSLMARYKVGMHFETGAGNDVLAGTGYGDNFVSGAGVNKIDGGANDGIDAQHPARDMLELYVADQAAADAVSVTELTDTMTGADGAAYAEGYRYKVTNGSVSTDYLKNVEAVSINIWTDKNGNGQRDYSSDSTKNEVSVARTVLVGPQPNTAPVVSNEAQTYVDGYHPGRLFASVSDAELNKLNSYAGATLTLSRHGGASADDVFVAGYSVSFANGILSVNGTAIGTVANAGGVLTLSFGAGATQSLVNSALGGIYYYNNGSGVPSGSITLDWTLSDGNSGAQGTGGSMTTTASTELRFDTIVQGYVRSATDPTVSVSGAKLAQLAHFATVFGTAGSETVDVTTDALPATVALMDEFHHGAVFLMGPGNDTVKGSAWDDAFEMGSGVNRVDGGGNGNSHNVDELDVYVPTAADAASVQISALGASATGADLQAFQDGYTVKVVNGAETDYLKNVQQVGVWVWNDANGNRLREAGETTLAQWTPLVARAYETQASSTDATRDTNGVLLSTLYNFASINGTMFGDSINAVASLSSTVRALMDTYHRGVYIDAGTGDDTIVGTGYGDGINAGAGVNRVDGGANAGTDPNGFAAQDYLQVYVNVQAGASPSAVKLTADMTGADGDAYKAGYTWKVSAPGETDYLKNIETVYFYNWNDANGNGRRDSGETSLAKSVLLAPRISEVMVSATDPTKDTDGNDLSTYYDFAWAEGTTEDDVIDASTVSATTLGLMAKYKAGMHFDSGAGNDVLTGTAYGDTFRAGAGVNKIDGGANDGRADALELQVTTQAAVDAVTVTALTDAMTGDDGKAYAEGYRFKVTNGTVSTDYLKNVEQVTVWLLNDKNGNGQMDPGESATLSRTIDLSGVANPPSGGINTAPKLNVSATLSASGLHPVPLAGGGTIFDNELAQKGSYEGAVLSVSRHGGANADDQFWAQDSQVSFDNGVLKVGTTTIGTVTNGGGTLTLVFGAGATQELVNQVLRSIGYANHSDAPPASVTLDWSLSDGNGGSQGSGGALTAAASTQVTIELVKFEVARDGAHPELSTDGVKLADYAQLGTVLGTARGETFNAGTGFSDAARALMDEFKHGATIATGGGGDNVTGTGYGDMFMLGKGVNYVDGGANVNGADLVFVSAGSAAAVDAAQVVRLTTGMQGADADAFTKGYTYKIVAGSETDYLKDIEWVNISGMDPDGTSNFRQVGLVLTVQPSDSSSNANAATILGTFMGDQIDASATGTLLPDAIKADMAATGRGLSILGGDGDDVITGSSHPDFIFNGKGNAKIDGGAADRLNGATGDDVFVITVPSVDAMKAVKVQASDDANYTWKVTYGPNSSEVDYLKNIEGIAISVANGTDSSWISLKVNVMELGSGGLRDVSIVGTSLPDVLDASAGGGLIPAGLQARMDQDKAGAMIDGGAGDDVITGTAYVDSFTNGPGSSKIDGGANASSQQTNGDEFQIPLPKAADVAAVTVQPSDDPNYQFMVTYGNGSTEKDYLKNVEMVFAYSVSDSATRQIPLVMSVQEVKATDPLDALGYYAHVVGTDFGDTFDAAVDVSSATRALMTEHQRGVQVDMGAGNDKVVGTAYSDVFVMGAGVNYVDGGANASGFQDTLHVFVTSQAAADAIVVNALDAGMTGTDKAAFDAGYTYKLVAGNETDYVKNVANYHVNLWIDANGNGYMDGGEVTSTDHVFGATPVKVDVVGVPTV